MSNDSAFNFHALSNLLAEYRFPELRLQWSNTLARALSFPLLDLPLEIILRILKLATANSNGAYPALLRTSRQIAGIARVDCVPQVVVLADRTSALSFAYCIYAHPGVGSGIRELWFVPGLKSEEVKVVGPAIFNACQNLTRLACFPNVLDFICSGSVFHHTALVDLTLMETFIPWERLFASCHGAALFAQIQRLRLIGANVTPPPLSTSFAALTDISLTARSVGSVQIYLLDHVRFPALARIVVTVSYFDWRDVGMGFLMSAPELANPRVCVAHCSKKWKEVEVWKGDPRAVWNQGAHEWNARNGGGIARDLA